MGDRTRHSLHVDAGVRFSRGTSSQPYAVVDPLCVHVLSNDRGFHLLSLRFDTVFPKQTPPVSKSCIGTSNVWSFAMCNIVHDPGA